MRKHHHEHLLIFCELDAGQSLWSWMGGKKDDSLRDHYFFRGQSGDLFLSKLEPLYFALFGLDHEDSPREDVLEVTGRLRRALDTEQVTKRFFSEYQQKHNDFYKSIKGIDNEHDQQRYASVLLNRMMFTWFLQKKGFLGGGDTDYLPTRLNAWHKKRPDSYYREFLLPLFFDGFGKHPQERSKKTISLVGDIPFLGGSLFLPHVLESKYPDTIQIDDEAFFGITKLFNSYTWHLDDRPGGDDDEIAPSVLGMIFEKYINQKQFGAYYTCEEITRHLCEQTIHKLILDRANATAGKNGAGYKSVDEMLAQMDDALCRELFSNILPTISILDPACGSGAFLIEAMRAMVEAYSAIIGKMERSKDKKLASMLRGFSASHPSRLYGIKKKVIAENLFGVDLMGEATESCRLRLYLSLVATVRSKEELEPLPNLDFNILKGNSLIGLLHAEADHKGQAGILGGNYKDTLEEYGREKRIYAQAEGTAKELLSHRCSIESKRKSSYENLNQYLLNKFLTLGINYQRATWDEKKGKLGKSTNEALTIDHINEIEPFHWGFDFGAILNDRGGFDIILTNPPWDAFKPNGKEFIERESYSEIISKNKMKVVDFDKELKKLMKIEEIKTAWLDYQSSYSYQSEWYRKADRYRNQSSKTVDPNTGREKKTGTDVNLYKLFLEQCHNLLREEGRCGIVIPSGFYTDLGAKGLREMLFDKASITGMFGLENRRRIFDGVDSRYKFVILTFEKGGTTETFPAAFMRHDVGELENFPQENSITQEVEQIKLSSPNSFSVMEARSEEDARIVKKLMRFTKLGDAPEEYRIKLSIEFHMTNDRRLFRTEEELIQKGWEREGDEWEKEGERCLPLYEGKMFHQYNHRFNRSGEMPRYWIEENEGRQALLGKQDDHGQALPYQSPRLAYRNIASSTNERTMIMTLLPGDAAGS